LNLGENFMSDSTTDLNTAQSQNFDAQQLAADIATGEQKAPKVNISEDYEASKEFSTSSVDQTGAGVEMAQAATAPQYELSEPEATSTTAEPTGNPDDYRDMAREVVPHAAGGNVTDELVQKALELGEPGQS
jgi:hypothetical protein